MPQAVVVGSEARIEKVTVEVVGVPKALVGDDVQTPVAAESSENSIGGTPQKCLAVRSNE